MIRKTLIKKADFYVLIKPCCRLVCVIKDKNRAIITSTDSDFYLSFIYSLILLTFMFSINTFIARQISNWKDFHHFLQNEMSHLMGKPTICIGENKGADQLRGNCEADQRLCFRYSDSTIPPLLNSKITSF